MSCFPDMLFDKQSDPARRAYLYTYDGFSLSFFEYYVPYPTAVVFVSKEHVSKLHPLFRKKQAEKVTQFEQRISEGKNIGHDAIIVTLKDLVENVGKENLICWLKQSRIDSDIFFDLIENGQIKINQ